MEQRGLLILVLAYGTHLLTSVYSMLMGAEVATSHWVLLATAATMSVLGSAAGRWLIGLIVLSKGVVIGYLAWGLISLEGLASGLWPALLSAWFLLIAGLVLLADPVRAWEAKQRTRWPTSRKSPSPP